MYDIASEKCHQVFIVFQYTHILFSVSILRWEGNNIYVVKTIGKIDVRSDE